MKIGPLPSEIIGQICQFSMFHFPQCSTKRVQQLKLEMRGQA